MPKGFYYDFEKLRLYPEGVKLHWSKEYRSTLGKLIYSVVDSNAEDSFYYMYKLPEIMVFANEFKIAVMKLLVF